MARKLKPEEVQARREKRAMAGKLQAAPLPTYPESSLEGVAVTGRGLKQGVLFAGEKAGFFPDGTFQSYTDEIRQKAEAYKQSLEGATPAQKISHFGSYMSAGSLPYMLGGEALGPAKAAATGVQAANRARTLTGVAMRGMGEGAAAGLLQPAYGEGDLDYLTQKGIHTGIGAGAGGVLGPLGDEAVRGMTYVGGRYVKPIVSAPFKAALNGLAKFGAAKGGSKAIAREVNPFLTQYGMDWDKLGSKMQRNLVREAKRQLRAGELDPDSLARKAFLESYELRPTRAQITQNRHDAVIESDLQKMPEVAEDLYEQHAAQPGIYKELMEKEARTQGADLGNTHEGVFDKAFTALETAWKKSQEEVGKLYDVAINSVDENGVRIIDKPVSLNNLRAALAEDGMEYFDYAAVKAAKNFLDGSAEGIPAIQAEAFRRGLGNAAKSSDPAERWAARRLVDAIDDDVVDSLQAEPFRAARDAARERFKRFDDKLIKKFLGDKQREDTFVKQHVLGGSSKRLKALVDALKKPPEILKGDKLKQAKEEGAKAVDALRGIVWDHLMEKGVAVDAAGDAIRIVGGDKGGFIKALDGIGMDKLKVLFTPEEIGKMYRLGKAGALLPLDSIPGQYINRSNTGSMILNNLNRMMKRGPQTTFLEVIPRAVGGEIAERQAARALSGSAVPEHQIGNMGESFIEGFNKLFPSRAGALTYGRFQDTDKKNNL
jgi:hypothetical protein